MSTGIDLASEANENLVNQLPWLLRLYIAGRSPKCVAALTNLNAFAKSTWLASTISR